MSNESIARIGGMVSLSVMMIAFSYLFSLNGNGTVSLILLFVGIFLAIALTGSMLHEDRKK